MDNPMTSGAEKPRMAYVDNIRWTVIAMVVLVHACVTYSGLGSWYYKEPAVLDLGAKLVFWMYSIFSQAFFMGLLFFVSATFMPGSYDKKGFARFIGERAFRLGIPALFFMLVLDPLTTLAREVGTGSLDSLPAALGRYPRFSRKRRVSRRLRTPVVRGCSACVCDLVCARAAPGRRTARRRGWRCCSRCG